MVKRKKKGKKERLIEIRGQTGMTKPLTGATVNQIGLPGPNAAALVLSFRTFVYVIMVLLLIGHDSLIIRGQFAFLHYFLVIALCLLVWVSEMEV